MAKPSTTSDCDDSKFWSEETCTLKEIGEKVTLPVVVKVCEGLYSENDCTSFSRGDIIKIDSSESETWAEAYVARWDGNEYRKTTEQLRIPLKYKGYVRVLPIHGVGFEYTSVRQLMLFMPSKVKIGSTVIFEDLKGKQNILMENEILENLTIVVNPEKRLIGLKVISRKSKMFLPHKMIGSFITVANDTKYTVEEIFKFRCPQCIKFIEQSTNNSFTNTFLEAVANFKTFTGEVILTGRKGERKFLFAHYKSFQSDSSAPVCRRNALILHPDHDVVANIEVRLPNNKNTSVYEDLVFLHFRNQSSEQSVEEALYIELFNKICLDEDAGSPSLSAVHSDNDTSVSALKPETAVACSEGEDIQRRKSDSSMEKCKTFPKSRTVLQKPSKFQMMSRKSETVQSDKHSSQKSVSGMPLIGDVFTSSMDLQKQENMLPEQPGKKSKIHTLGRFIVEQTRLIKKQSPNRMSAQFYSASVETPNCDGDNVYDYIDDREVTNLQVKTLDRKIYDNVKARFSFTERREVTSCTDKKRGEYATRQSFAGMSVQELRDCFFECGLPELAELCITQKIDGELFDSLSRDQLRKEPFRLSKFELLKVKKIQRGWRPKLDD